MEDISEKPTANFTYDFQDKTITFNAPYKTIKRKIVSFGVEQDYGVSVVTQSIEQHENRMFINTITQPEMIVPLVPMKKKFIYDEYHNIIDVEYLPDFSYVSVKICMKQVPPVEPIESTSPPVEPISSSVDSISSPVDSIEEKVEPNLFAEDCNSIEEKVEDFEELDADIEHNDINFEELDASLDTQINPPKVKKNRKKSIKNNKKAKDDALLENQIKLNEELQKKVSIVKKMNHCFFRMESKTITEEAKQFLHNLSNRESHEKIFIQDKQKKSIDQMGTEEMIPQIVDICEINMKKYALINYDIVDEDGQILPINLTGNICNVIKPNKEMTKSHDTVMMVEKGIIFDVAFHNEIPFISTGISLNPAKTIMVISSFVNEQKKELCISFDKLLTIALLPLNFVNREKMIYPYIGKFFLNHLEPYPGQESAEILMTDFIESIKPFLEALDKTIAYTFLLTPLLSCGLIDGKENCEIGAKLCCLWQHKNSKLIIENRVQIDNIPFAPYVVNLVNNDIKLGFQGKPYHSSEELMNNIINRCPSFDDGGILPSAHIGDPAIFIESSQYFKSGMEDVYYNCALLFIYYNNPRDIVAGTRYEIFMNTFFEKINEFIDEKEKNALAPYFQNLAEITDVNIWQQHIFNILRGTKPHIICKLLRL